MLRYSFGEHDAAKTIEAAVNSVINSGLRTGDLFTGKDTEQKVNTAEMTSAITDAI